MEILGNQDENDKLMEESKQELYIYGGNGILSRLERHYERSPENDKEAATKRCMRYLEKRYPCIAIWIYERLKFHHAIRRYMNDCKKYEEDPFNYTLYVHGYLIPHIDEMRKNGQLT